MTPFRVLIVDGEPVIRRMMQLILSRMPGIQVLEPCASVESALVRIQEGGVGLVISELHFPPAVPGGPLGGPDLFLPCDPMGPLMVFSNGRYADYQPLLDQGALAVVLKPVSNSDLRALVLRAKAVYEARHA